MLVTHKDQRLCYYLRNLPREFNYRYTPDAHRRLLELLFTSLADDNDEYLSLFFPHGPPNNPLQEWSLREAQGAVEGAEYTEAARGKRCGHIFKTGDATYRCKACQVDDTCVLCAKCYEASDHEGHEVLVSYSPGNSGCCDCGDDEAWNRPVLCSIHTLPSEFSDKSKGKAKEALGLPDELLQSIRLTIARVLDYLCDVFSCAPEQMRQAKTEKSIRDDEKHSRLASKWYGGSDYLESDEDQEYALILWNDEKHTIIEVKDQVSRACKKSGKFGEERALEVDDIGRSIVEYSTNVDELLRKAKIIEEIKVTVSIRSSRDTFREQMCGSIVGWLSDISGCSVAHDNQVLLNTLCEEMLRPWRTGSEAINLGVGVKGIHDHEAEEQRYLRRRPSYTIVVGPVPVADGTVPGVDDDEEGADEEEQVQDDDVEEVDDTAQSMETDDADRMEVDEGVWDEDDRDFAMENAEYTEVAEATHAGYPAPPPPPPRPLAPVRQRNRSLTPADSDDDDRRSPDASIRALRPMVPKTPTLEARSLRAPRPPKHWLIKPSGYATRQSVPIHEDLWDRVRLDFLILYDLRMWKRLRINLRDLYIGTVVAVPYFKRILGLRFAGLYTILAQLYLIADREPDHSIINLSLQMLTTPSITEEVIERGNFLTNLNAILYTFLTTRQVGYPTDVDPLATLAFDAGVATNRRLYHFFSDLRWLFASEYVRARLRKESHYLYQFLDLIKLAQGICPNVRMVGEHIEYETDAWISAQVIAKHMNGLCRHFSESFKGHGEQMAEQVRRAIHVTASAAIINSLGLERKRFTESEIKREVQFKDIGCYDDRESGPDHHRMVVDFVVEQGAMSFHHPLHYMLSWLIDRGKSMDNSELCALLAFSKDKLEKGYLPSRVLPIPSITSEQMKLVLFDYPLRVCAWLAQMRAGMWVRNGITLRHQMSTYRGVAQRDVSYQRDIFLLQVALVTCNRSDFLASMIDRFGVTGFVTGTYRGRQGWEDHQLLDVAEDFVHLLIVLLCDRTPLLSVEDEPRSNILAARRDIAHALCFRPLSYSDITTRLAERHVDLEEFNGILEDMTKYRPPEGMSDTGTFELKEHLIQDVDPYVAYYTKNQREEAESAYRAYFAKKTGRPVEEVCFEPKLRRIRSGPFKEIGSFTCTTLFAQIILHGLRYPLVASHVHEGLPVTRVEVYLQVVLHLTLAAVLEDDTDESDNSEMAQSSFASLALSKHANSGTGDNSTIFSILRRLSRTQSFKACHTKIVLIQRHLQQRRPRQYAAAVAALGLTADEMDTETPTGIVKATAESKKKQALERQAKVMAQLKKQQDSFMEKQSINWGEQDFSDLDEETEPVNLERTKLWKYPSGTCILCQEETNDQRLFGTFAYITESRIFRQTNIKDQDFVAEACTTPDSLDRSADSIRPFGLAGQNVQEVVKVTADGRRVALRRQGLGKGFPSSMHRRGPISTGCGHIMHYSCFELYLAATQRRHQQHIARNHPERLLRKEFLCPLCKALGNTFLPIVWKGKQEVYPGPLEPELPFGLWLDSQLVVQISRLDKGPERFASAGLKPQQRIQELFSDYGSQAFVAPLSSTLHELNTSNYISPPAIAPPHFTRPMPPSWLEPYIHEPRLPAATSSVPVRPRSPAISELLRIYHRLSDTIRYNDLESRYQYPSNQQIPGIHEDLPNTDTLAMSLGYSISGLEIAQRGIASEPGATLLDKVPQQALTHLRIFSETVSSYMTVGGLISVPHLANMNKTVAEFVESQGRQLRFLFMGHPQIAHSNSFGYTDRGRKECFLHQDPFIFLTECSVCLAPALRLDIHHILRVCYMAEIVRVVIAFCREPQGAINYIEGCDKGKMRLNTIAQLGSQPMPDQMENFRYFVRQIEYLLHQTSSEDMESSISGSAEDDSSVLLLLLYRLIHSYALPFLRKSAILLHVRYGVDFPSTGFSDPAESELDRLTHALRLPTVDELLESYLSESSVGEIMRSMAAAWIGDWANVNEELKRAVTPRGYLPSSMPLSHPAIFELVGLPKTYDLLIDAAMKRRCPTTGKEVNEPNICLFCGEIFCGQSYCCTRDKHGGCWQHQEKCGGNIGLFINLRKCNVLFLNGSHGCWAPAPYLDKHGEADPGLRRSHQLFLNQKRYDALLRSVWLNHGIPTTISRKLEADVNNGGWETL